MVAQEKQNTWSGLKDLIAPLEREGKQACKQHTAGNCGRNITLTSWAQGGQCSTQPCHSVLPRPALAQDVLLLGPPKSPTKQPESVGKMYTPKSKKLKEGSHVKINVYFRDQVKASWRK